MTKKLPILVEMSVGQSEVYKRDLVSKVESNLRSEVRSANLSITCSPGCANCCYRPVSVSILEGISIYRALNRRRKWTLSLKKTLQEVAAKQLQTTNEIWLLSLIPCPLLTPEKTCLAGDARPFSCRTLFSVGDPYFCHPHRLGPQTGVIAQDGVLDTFRLKSTELLRKHGVQIVEIPLAQALLLAERVCSGSLDLAQLDAEVMKEFSNG